MVAAARFAVLVHKSQWSRPDPSVLLFQAIFAHPVHTHFHFLDAAGIGFPQRLGFNTQAFRIKTVHLTTAGAVEMGMGSMMFIGRQAVIKSPATGADTLDDPASDQQIENAIDGHPVDGSAAIQGFEYIACGQRETVVTDNFQHTQPIGCGLQAGRRQQFRLVASMANGVLRPLADSLQPDFSTTARFTGKCLPADTRKPANPACPTVCFDRRHHRLLPYPSHGERHRRIGLSEGVRHCEKFFLVLVTFPSLFLLNI